MHMHAPISYIPLAHSSSLHPIVVLSRFYISIKLNSLSSAKSLKSCDQWSFIELKTFMHPNNYLPPSDNRLFS